MTRREQDLEYQQNQEYQEQQKKNDDEKHYYNYYYNNYHTEPGVFPRVLSKCDQQLLLEAYNDNIGQMTGVAARMIEQAFENGLEVEEIVMAIEETGLASRPSAYYLRAVLQNWAETGVTVSRARHEVRTNKAQKWWKG